MGGNLLEILRLSRLLRPRPEEEEDAGFQLPQEQDHPDAGFGPPVDQAGPPALASESPSLDEYRKHLRAMPTREEHDPGFWRKLQSAAVGGLTGATEGARAGIGAAREVKERPYQSALGDWMTKGKMLGEEANIESTRLETTRRGEHDRATISQRESAAKQRHEAELARIDAINDRNVAAGERDKEIARHNKEMEKIGGRQAGAAESRAATYGKRATGSPATRQPTPANQDRAMRRAVSEAVDEYPQVSEGFYHAMDEGSARAGTIKHPGMSADKETIQRYKNFKAIVDAKVRRILQGEEEPRNDSPFDFEDDEFEIEDEDEGSIP